MVAKNTDNHETAFTVTVDHVDTTTGVSPAERAYTIQKLLDPNAKPEDFRRPGHVFPLVYKRGWRFSTPRPYRSIYRPLSLSRLTRGSCYL